MAKKNIPIIYEDDHLVVLNKPAGVLSIPHRFKPETFNLKDYLDGRFGKIFVVHRLDRDTSGVVCFAKTEEAHRGLSQQFEGREVTKYYHAMLDGEIQPEKGRIEAGLNPDPAKKGRMIVATKGKPAITHYELEEAFRHFSWVKVKIETGRTHQIRVHFQHLGYPLAVDSFYGRKDALFLSAIKGKRYRLGKGAEERPLVSRCTLHASQLIINHPITNDRLSLEAPLPKDLNALLRQLRANASK